jgi:hypothetical protein
MDNDDPFLERTSDIAGNDVHVRVYSCYILHTIFSIHPDGIRNSVVVNLAILYRLNSTTAKSWLAKTETRLVAMASHDVEPEHKSMYHIHQTQLECRE